MKITILRRYQSPPLPPPDLEGFHESCHLKKKKKLHALHRCRGVCTSFKNRLKTHTAFPNIHRRKQNRNEVPMRLDDRTVSIKPVRHSRNSNPHRCDDETTLTGATGPIKLQDSHLWRSDLSFWVSVSAALNKTWASPSLLGTELFAISPDTDGGPARHNFHYRNNNCAFLLLVENCFFRYNIYVPIAPSAIAQVHDYHPHL